jgi:hypothetical protein
MRHLTFSLLILGSPVAADAQETIREQVLTNGVSEELVVVDHPSLSFGELVSTAGAVVHVSVRTSETFLSSDGRSIFTDYRVAVIDVLKESSGPRIGAGDTITIRRVGGVMNIEGRRVFSNEAGFPRFTTGDNYVLFLKTQTGQPHEIMAGSQSAFRVQQGTVAPLVGSIDQAPGVVLPVFTQELRELLSPRPSFTR